MPNVRIRCPKCDWEPDEICIWMCSVCNTRWNTFETRGQCPACGKIYEETMCIGPRGGCGQMSRHEEWYQYEEKKTTTKSFFSFWKKKDKLPVTETDKIWIEQSLLLLAEMFEPVYFKSLVTITPEHEYFKRRFTGTEEDAQYIFEKLVSIMQIDAWEIRLMFYSTAPTAFTEGIVATPQDKLKGSWKTSTGRYVDNGLSNKEIWIELGQLRDPVSLIATLSHELAHYKLMGEYRMEENDELLTDLTAIAFGFGIFKGNSYFKYSQWTGSSHQGWQMRKSGYLPEQVIAYAMAWLAHYRNEDIGWKHFLNKTMKKYFEQSYAYIANSNPTMLG